MSGGEKLSSPREYQRRCVRGKDAVQSAGNSMEMCLGDIGRIKGDISGAAYVRACICNASLAVWLLVPAG